MEQRIQSEQERRIGEAFDSRLAQVSWLGPGSAILLVDFDGGRMTLSVKGEDDISIRRRFGDLTGLPVRLSFVGTNAAWSIDQEGRLDCRTVWKMDHLLAYGKIWVVFDATILESSDFWRT